MDQPSPPISPPERHPDDLPPDPSATRHLPRGVAWAAALFVVVLAIASFVALSNDSSSTTAGDDVVRLDPNAPQPANPGLQTPDPSGSPAPTVAFPTFAGTDSSFAELEGTPVVVNFWASFCTPCIKEMPDLERLHQEYGDQVRFIGVDAPSDAETAARGQAQLTGVTYPLAFDRSGTLAKSFGVNTLPATYLIDRDGTIVYRHLNAVTADELRALIDEKLNP